MWVGPHFSHISVKSWRRADQNKLLRTECWCDKAPLPSRPALAWLAQQRCGRSRLARSTFQVTDGRTEGLRHRVKSPLLRRGLNPLKSRGSYSATSNNMKLVHWPLQWLVFWYSEEGTGRGCSSPRPLLAVPNVTAHPSTASVPNTVLLYNGQLLYGFIVSI